MKARNVALAAGLLLVSAANTVRGGAAYTLTLLGQLPTVPNSMAYAINDQGEIAGYSEDFGSSTPHAFLWQPGSGLEDLNPSIGLNISFAKGINDSGQVVGSCAGNNNHPFLWQSGSPTQFLPWSTNANANAINASGQVVGVDDVSEACLWQGSSEQILGSGAAYAINQSGQVVGQSGNHAFLWQSGSGMQQIDSAGGWSSSCAYGINQQGQIVGNGSTTGGRYDAFLWQSSAGMQDLDPSGAWSSSYALGINNSQQVVGWASNGGSLFPFVWQATTGIENLNSLITASPGFTLTEATAINNAGQIVGWGTTSSNEREAFLLTPAPIPGDANGDGRVDVNDLTIVLSNFGRTGMVWSQGEFTGDGTVDVNDLTIILINFGTTTAVGVAPVPEPPCAVLLGLAAAGLLAAARRASTPPASIVA